jgi:hypothetical protein
VVDLGDEGRLLVELDGPAFVFEGVGGDVEFLGYFLGGEEGLAVGGGAVGVETGEVAVEGDEVGVGFAEGADAEGVAGAEEELLVVEALEARVGTAHH